MKLYDVIIIGGGPAGLNAAVVLGRCHREVLLLDYGRQRNRSSHGIHNYLTRDGIFPSEFLKLAQNEIRKFGVHYRHSEVRNARKNPDGTFTVVDSKKISYHSRKLILATGLTDNVPDLPGIKKFYGISVFHCPYCDGWENTGKKIGVFAKTKAGIGLAFAMLRWSKDVTLYTNGVHYVRRKYAKLLAANNITIINHPVVALRGKGGHLEYVALDTGEKVKCDALFFSTGYHIQSNLAGELGCVIDEKKVVITNRAQKTNIPGLFVAGDAAKDVHFVIVAAAEGAKAGVYVNKELLSEEMDIGPRSHRIPTKIPGDGT